MQQSIDQRFLDISLPTTAKGWKVATLGPAGTSSELAAQHLIKRLPGVAVKETPELFHSYEMASRAVIQGTADLLVVANAYANVSEFYMDTTLSLVGAYHYQTPQYGIAVPTGTTLTGPVRIASHPAPTPLIEQLLPKELSVKEVVLADSTSAAALAARSGRVDAALTTQPSAERYGLTFISGTRPIDMLWSVFSLAHATDPVAA
ncbi:prephenate dehydratase domain-containing protein [Streptomyces sp. B1I3]|uniref:prephenate dehydratase domain-containing protein n=1 Tax=Streptomyces sp. B1I3 TaxID=3042264 RepID=UPI002787AC14|nr:prephenate dehydratase domain-containing protein [Streptomyces sp. B1I3]MDQ0794221.1 prephenate dehydratase [Streptomyces sp. B1I3]